MEEIISHAGNPQAVDRFTCYHDVKVVKYIIMKKKGAILVRHLMEGEIYNLGTLHHC